MVQKESEAQSPFGQQLPQLVLGVGHCARDMDGYVLLCAEVYIFQDVPFFFNQTRD